MSKLFCIGFFKTGTLSLKYALDELGYTTRHGFVKQSDLILKAIGDKVKPLTYLNQNEGEYDAYLDLYAVRDYFALLDGEYPDSKFILTTRETDKWIPSVKRQIKKNPNSPYFHHYYYQIPMQWKYQKESEESCIREYFKDRDNFLEIDITKGEGWEPICEFLGKDVPDIEFPHRNRSRK